MRVLQRQPKAIAIAFAVAAFISLVVAAWPRSAPTPSPILTADTSAAQSRADALHLVKGVFAGQLEETRKAIANRDEALASMDAQGAQVSPAESLARLAVVRRRASALAADIARDRATLAGYQTAANTPRPVDPQVAEFTAALSDAQAQLAALENRLTPQHPDVLRQRATVRERQAQLLTASERARTAAAADASTRDATTVLARISENERAARRAQMEIGVLEKGGNLADASTEERARLTRERESLIAVRDALQQRDAEIRRQAEAALAGVPDASAAAVSPLPVARRIDTRALLVGLAASAFAAFAVGFVVDARDTRIHDDRDLRAAVPLPLLVTISEIIPTTAPAAADREVSALPEPSSPLLVWHPRCPRRSVEQYRRLAQSLRRRRADTSLRVVGVTSALPGEGKTLTAVNLAASLAESYRQRVLLVDADLRRPAVSRLLNIAPQEGLSEWLRQDDERECPMVRLTSRLSVVPAGAAHADPTALLTSLRMAMLVAAARADFDWVVIDTPPTGLIADAGALEGNLDGCVVIAAAGRTEAPVLQQTIAALGPGRVLGLVLNRVTRSGGVDSDSYSDYYAAPTPPQ